MQDFSLARRAMVDSQLRPEGVTDRGVLAAMGSVARERFVPECARALAYFDRPLPLADGRAMMPPAALGRLLQRACPPRRRAGAGRRLGHRIFGGAAPGDRAGGRRAGIGRAARRGGCAARASKRSTGDLAEGWTKGAPYDLILLDGAVEEVPAALVKQLAPRWPPCRRHRRSRRDPPRHRPGGRRRARPSQPCRRRCRHSSRIRTATGLHLLIVSERPPVTRHLAIASLLAALAAGTASADTLREALVSTYQANPTLTAPARGAEGDRRRRRHRPRRPAGRRSAARSASPAT